MYFDIWAISFISTLLFSLVILLLHFMIKALNKTSKSQKEYKEITNALSKTSSVFSIAAVLCFLICIGMSLAAKKEISTYYSDEYNIEQIKEELDKYYIENIIVTISKDKQEKLVIFYNKAQERYSYKYYVHHEYEKEENNDINIKNIDFDKYRIGD